MIRKFEEKEIPHLIEIWEKAAMVAHPFLSEDFHEEVKKAMTDIYLPNSDTWVYVESGKVLGFISMISNEIGGLFVFPENHSKGIGTLLVNHINQFHKELEVEVFYKNEIGKPFYEKLGFETIKEYIMDGTNQKILRMRK